MGRVRQRENDAHGHVLLVQGYGQTVHRADSQQRVLQQAHGYGLDAVSAWALVIRDWYAGGRA